MPSFERWAGRASERLTLSADATLSSRIRVQRVEASVVGVELALPDARRIGSLGGPVMVVWNTGANSIDITDNGGTLIGTVAEDELASLFLIAKNDADGEWRIKIESTDVIPAGGVNDFFTTIGAGNSSNDKLPWKYDHAGNSWSSGTAATTAMQNSAGIMSAGIGYVPGPVGLSAVQQYDPDTWTNLGNTNFAAADRSAVDDAGQGDWYGQQSSAFVYKRHDRYSVSGDSWSTGTNLTQNHRFGGSDNLEAGTNLIHGGTDDGALNWTNATTNAQTHATSGDTFTVKTNMTTDSRAGHGHFTLGGDVFVVAGLGTRTGSVLRDSVYSYNLSGDSWTSRTAWPPGQVGPGPSGATRDAGVAYAAGGQGSKAARSYQVDTWSTIADHGDTGAQHRWTTETTFALVT